MGVIRVFLSVVAVVLGLGLQGAAAAYPNKPIRLLVGYPPGSATDLYGRAIAQYMAEELGQAVVVENRPGAAGNIAVMATVRAEPDGYTLLNSASQIVVNPFVQKINYDPISDIRPITQTLAVSYVLVTRPDFPAKNLPELIQYVKGRSEQFNYGSYGSGSGPHLTMVMLNRLAEINPTHIPYKGSPQVLSALLSGEIDMAFDTTTSITPLVESGQIKAIAIAGPEPVPTLPGVRPIAETFPGFDTDGWQGVFAPKGTPDHIVKTVERAVRNALKIPKIQEMSKARGVRLVGSSAEQFKAYFAEELRKYERVVRENKIQMD